MRIFLAAVLAAAPAAASDLTILVAAKDTPAYETAKAKADGSAVVSAGKLGPAFDKAAEHLNACGDCTVTIKVASGEQTGKGGAPHWPFPEVKAPGAALLIMGGFDAAFEKRAPLTAPTRLVVGDSMTMPVVKFEGRKGAVLKELTLSGFLIDSGAANRYDAKSNSLKKGSSPSSPLLAFGYLTAERLTIADNVFLNSSSGVSEPLLRPAGSEAEVLVRNNVFLNNVFCWRARSPSSKTLLKRYRVEGNTFVRNWPYNPDPTTSNPGTLEIGDRYTASSVEIVGNLFALNYGGAIFPQYDDKAGPKVSIQDNLFFGNGALFGATKPGAGAVIGKFNRAAKHAAYDAADLEDDFSWKVSDNVAIDPKIEIAVVKTKAVNYKGSDHHEAAEEPEEGAEAGAEGGEAAPEAAADGVPIVPIKNYAPRLELPEGAIPFPAEPKARRYGASPSRAL